MEDNIISSNARGIFNDFVKHLLENPSSELFNNENLINIQNATNISKYIHNEDDILFCKAVECTKIYNIKVFLELTTNPSERKKMIESAFNYIKKSDYVNVANRIIEVSEPNKKKEVIDYIIDWLFEREHFDLIMDLSIIYRKTILQNFIKNNYELIGTGIDRDLMFQEKFWTEFVIGNYNALLEIAVRNEDIEIINTLRFFNNDSNHINLLFRKAASHGKKKIFELELAKIPDLAAKKQLIIDNKIFSEAGVNGHIDIINQCFEIINDPMESEKIISKDDHEIFRKAGANGHAKVISIFLKIYIYSKDRIKTVSSRNYEVFRKAGANGHIEVINEISTFIKNKAVWKKMIRSEDYEAFREAGENGHIKVINELSNIITDPIELQKMIRKTNYSIFIAAAISGNIEIFNRLLEISNGIIDLQNMLRRNDYEVFMAAAKNGNLEIFNRLLEISNGLINLQNMLRSKDYLVFRNAATSDNMEIFNKLLEIVTDPIELKNILSLRSKDYLVVRNAATSDNMEIFNKSSEIVNDPIIGPYRISFVFVNDVSRRNLEVIDKLLKSITDPVKLKDMISYGAYALFRVAASNSCIETLARIAVEISEKDLPYICLQNRLLYNVINIKTKPYLENPSQLIKLGQAHQNMIERNWNYQNIKEVSNLVKQILPFTLVSKKFLKQFSDYIQTDEYIMAKIIKYASHDDGNSSLNDDHRSLVLNAMKRKKPLNELSVIHNKIDTNTSFLERLVGQRKSQNKASKFM